MSAPVTDVPVATVPVVPPTTTSVVSPIVVDSTNLRNNYNTVLADICATLLGRIVEHVAGVKNENGESVRINVGDWANTLTHAIQAHRAANQE